MQGVHGHKDDVIILICELYHFVHPSLVILHSDKTAEDTYSVIYMHYIITYRKGCKVIDGKLLAFIHTSSYVDTMKSVEYLMVTVTAYLILIIDESIMKIAMSYEFWHQSTFGPVPLYQAHLDIMGQIELFVSQPGKWTFAPKSVADHLCSSPRLRQCTPSFRIPNRSLYLLRHRDTAETANVRCFLDTLRDVLLERNTEGLLL
jgi:hypothetical protein